MKIYNTYSLKGYSFYHFLSYSLAESYSHCVKKYDKEKSCRVVDTDLSYGDFVQQYVGVDSTLEVYKDGLKSKEGSPYHGYHGTIKVLSHSKPMYILQMELAEDKFDMLVSKFKLGVK